MPTPHSLPSVILWEVTYACPLRCTHCYSESGVRPSRQLPLPQMLRLADVLAAMRPRVVHMSGGEPAIVKGLGEVIARLAAAGVSVVITTSGFGGNPELWRAWTRHCHSIHVSLDGANAQTHDRIRGRAGSFDAALAALAALDELAREKRRAGGPRLRFGIDCVVLRSNFDELPLLVSEVVRRFTELEFVIFNGVVPQGLASRESYAGELPTDEQMRRLGEPAFAESLQALAPPGVVVAPRDNLDLQMHPEHVREGTAWTLDRLIVEPDGLVRALEIYEGHVGNLLEEPAEVIWGRVKARREDPFVVAELAPVRTVAGWAEAVRRIDQRFASPDDLIRIAKRKPHSA